MSDGTQSVSFIIFFINNLKQKTPPIGRGFDIATYES